MVQERLPAALQQEGYEKLGDFRVFAPSVFIEGFVTLGYEKPGDFSFCSGFWVVYQR